MAARTLRALADAQAPRFLDQLTGEIFTHRNGDDLSIQVGCVNDGQHLTAAGVGTLTLEVKQKSANGESAAVMRRTLAAGDCDSGFTAGDWENGGALVVADFTATEAALTPGPYVIAVRHEDPGGKKLTYAEGAFQVLPAIIESASLEAPPLPADEYYTKAESDGRYPPQADHDALETTVAAEQTAQDGRLTVLETAKIDRAAPSVDANLDLQGNAIVGASSLDLSADPVDGNKAARKSYVDKFKGPYAVAIMKGGMHVHNSAGNETRPVVEGTLGNADARWLADDDTDALQVEIVRNSQNSPVRLDVCLYADSSNNARPVFVDVQRNLDIDGAGQWISVAKGNARNSAQRVTGVTKAYATEAPGLVALSIIDESPIASGVSKVAYRVVIGVDAAYRATVNTSYQNRVAQLDGTDGISSGDYSYTGVAVSTLTAQEIYTP